MRDRLVDHVVREPDDPDPGRLLDGHQVGVVDLGGDENRVDVLVLKSLGAVGDGRVADGAAVGLELLGRHPADGHQRLDQLGRPPAAVAGDDPLALEVLDGLDRAVLEHDHRDDHVPAEVTGDQAHVLERGRVVLALALVALLGVGREREGHLGLALADARDVDHASADDGAGGHLRKRGGNHRGELGAGPEPVPAGAGHADLEELDLRLPLGARGASGARARTTTRARASSLLMRDPPGRLNDWARCAETLRRPAVPVKRLSARVATAAACLTSTRWPRARWGVATGSRSGCPAPARRGSVGRPCRR